MRDEQEADDERRRRDGGPWEEDQRFHQLNNAAWAANSEWWNALFNRGRDDTQEAQR